MGAIEEARQSPRKQSQQSILICYPSQDGSNRPVHHRCRTQDISETGLKVVARRPLPLGSVLPVDVQTSQPDVHFQFLGEVKWCLEIDEAPTFFAGIKILEVIENNIENWQDFARAN